MKSLTNVHGRNVAVYGFGAFQEDKNGMILMNERKTLPGHRCMKKTVEGRIRR